MSKEAGLHTPRKPIDYAALGYMSPTALAHLREADYEREYGKGLGVVVVDVNGDGKPDIFVANDTTDKFLYVNRSVPGQLRFEDVARQANVATDDQGLPNGSMGVDAGDYDGSGLPSLLVANFENESHTVYRNLSRGQQLLFEFAPLTLLGRRYVGFGTGFVDIDNDGWEDLVFCNGHVIRHPTRAGVRQRPVLIHNQGTPANGSRVQLSLWTDQGGELFPNRPSGTRPGHRGPGQ